jgi:hypothetical protein
MTVTSPTLSELLEARMDAAEDVIFAYDDLDHATARGRAKAEAILQQKRLAWGEARRRHAEAMQS